MHIRELAETEAVSAGGVGIAVHNYACVVTWYLEQFAHLLIQLEVGYVAPVLRRSLCCEL